VGVSVVNALSSRTEVEVTATAPAHDRLRTRRQGRGAGEGRKAKKTGTLVRFWPDADVFETTDLDHDTVLQRLRETALLNPGPEIVLVDERDGRSSHAVVPQRSGRLRRTSCSPASDPLVPRSWSATSARSTATRCARRRVHLVGRLPRRPPAQLRQHRAHRRRRHPRGGLPPGADHHAQQVRSRQSGALLKKDPNLTGDDVREGLVAVVSLKIPDPQFEGQTKGRLGSTSRGPTSSRCVAEAFAAWLAKHRAKGRQIVKRASVAAKARQAAKAAA
jgi:DNA gyrase subunit B